MEENNTAIYNGTERVTSVENGNNLKILYLFFVFLFPGKLHMSIFFG